MAVQARMHVPTRLLKVNATRIHNVSGVLWAAWIREPVTGINKALRKFSLSDTDITLALPLGEVRRNEAVRANGVGPKVVAPTTVAPTTVGEVVRAVAPYLTADLISPTHLTHLQTIAGRLPTTLTNYFGFECRLGEAAATADILFCVRQVANQPLVLAGLRRGIPEEWGQQETVWQRVRDFGREWATPTSRLFRKVQDIWLEFDVAGPPDAIPIPSLFFGSKVIHAGIPANAHRWISEEAVRLLTGRPLTVPLQQSLLACIAALPDHALLFQMGAMLSREPAFVRVCLSRLTAEMIWSYLEAVGWSGERSRLAPLLDDLSPFTGSFALDLDLLEGKIGPRIGLECGLQKGSTTAEWSPFLDYLVAQGLCLPGKRDGLLHYLVSDDDAGPVERGLHHIKVVLESGVPTEAKAYLSVVNAAGTGQAGSILG